MRLIALKAACVYVCVHVCVQVCVYVCVCMCVCVIIGKKSSNHIMYHKLATLSNIVL